MYRRSQCARSVIVLDEAVAGVKRNQLARDDARQVPRLHQAQPHRLHHVLVVLDVERIADDKHNTGGELTQPLRPPQFIHSLKVEEHLSAVLRHLQLDNSVLGRVHEHVRKTKLSPVATRSVRVLLYKVPEANLGTYTRPPWLAVNAAVAPNMLTISCNRLDRCCLLRRMRSSRVVFSRLSCRTSWVCDIHNTTQGQRIWA